MIRIILSLVVSVVFVVALPGGVQDVDTNGPPPFFGKPYKLAKLTLVPIDYVKMTKQVVAGIKYTVKFTAGPLECFDDVSYSETEACASNKKLCELSYVVQSWENDAVTLASGANNELICHAMSESSHAEDFIDPDLVETVYNKSTDDELRALFDQFISDFGRDYRPDSNDGIYWKRFSVFKKNMAIVRQLRKNKKDNADYGITKFMDYTRYEYKRYLAPGLTRPEFESKHIDVATSGDTPKAFDWREHGAVTEVKNQGRCGSCWAFSTTGNVEGQWFLKKGKLVSLSEQELVDCDSVDHGCQGGLPSNAYKSIEKLGGLETEKEYPYEGSGETCQFKKSDAVAFVNDSVTLPSDEGKMASWLYKNGPISIGINAMAMQFYTGGVSHPWKFLCNPSSLDHGVLIVGYGVTSIGEPYWIIKNSWGANWGEKGYYRIYRGDGSCGVNQVPTSAVVN